MTKRFVLFVLTFFLLATPVLADGGYREPASAGGCGLLIILGAFIVVGVIAFASMAKDNKKVD